MIPATLDPATEALAHRVIGLALEVHTVLGPGLLEKLYEEALVIELQRAEIPVLRQVEVPVPYKDAILRGQRIDLLVARTLVVEVKATATILDIHKAQTLSYLRTGPYPLGLILNFHAPSLRQGIARVINSAARPTPTLPAPSPSFPPLSLASRPSPPSRPSR